MAPGHFRLDDDHVARPLHPVVEADDAVLEAASNCPLDAIAVFDAVTGEPQG